MDSYQSNPQTWCNMSSDPYRPDPVAVVAEAIAKLSYRDYLRLVDAISDCVGKERNGTMCDAIQRAVIEAADVLRATR